MEESKFVVLRLPASYFYKFVNGLAYWTSDIDSARKMSKADAQKQARQFCCFGKCKVVEVRQGPTKREI